MWKATVASTPPTCTLTVTPSTITQGQSATLSWTSTNATSGSIDNGIGTVTPVASGSRTITPAQTTKYTGTFTGPGGSTNCETTITVNPLQQPTCSLRATPSTINRGQSATLSWTSMNATGGTITNIGSVGPSGSTTVSPAQTTTYTGTFTGPGGSTSCEITITVIPAPVTRPACELASTLGDFNGDARADLLFRRTDGALLLFVMNGFNVQAAQVIGQIGTEWSLAGVGDFNGDGMADILFRRTDGALLLFLMNGSQVVGTQIIGQLGTDWKFLGLADFNGDGKVDMLFQHADGKLLLYLMNGFQQVAAEVIGQLGTDWKFVGAGDFNGDDRDDMLFRRTDGTLLMYLMDGFQQLGAQVIGQLGTDWIPSGLGDLNGDGRGDIVFRRTDGTLLEFQMNGFQVQGSQVFSVLGSEWNGCFD